MATIDQQFVEYIVKTLVNNPGNVAVDRTIDEKGVLLSLTVLRALGTKNDARYNLKIVNTDNFEGGEAKAPKAAPKAAEAPAEEATEEVAEEPAEEAEETSSELAEKTRAELADLDDLDI